MHAMILAAGHGERMLNLTNDKPKSLLEIAGKPLIIYQIEALVLAGVKKIVINKEYINNLNKLNLSPNHVIINKISKGSIIIDFKINTS